MKIQLQMKFIQSFQGSMENIDVKRGTIANIDSIVFDSEYASGVKVRVVNVWKKPQYLDLGWFVKEQKS